MLHRLAAQPTHSLPCEHCRGWHQPGRGRTPLDFRITRVPHGPTWIQYWWVGSRYRNQVGDMARAWSQSPFNRVVQHAELGMLGEYLGQHNGDSRRVCRLLKYPDWIYKEYRTEVSPDGAKQLDRLIRLPEQMKPADKALVDAHTSWPVARVVNTQQATIGVLMPLAPDAFRTAWQLPSGRIRHGWLAVDVLALTEDRQTQIKLSPQPLYSRMSICTSIAAVGALLERSDLVYLDWSYANVFWSMLDHSAYVIDLDGCSFGPRLQIESPNWADPLVPRRLNAGNESDRYRVALLVARCLTGIRSDVAEVREALDGLRWRGETISRVARLLIQALNA